MTERPRTAEEMMALPIGPEFGIEERVIDGKTYRVPIAPRLKVTFFDDTDPFMVRDQDGHLWMVGQYADGRWFRRRGPW